MPVLKAPDHRAVLDPCQPAASQGCHRPLRDYVGETLCEFSDGSEFQWLLTPKELPSNESVHLVCRVKMETRGCLPVAIDWEVALSISQFLARNTFMTPTQIPSEILCTQKVGKYVSAEIPFVGILLARIRKETAKSSLKQVIMWLSPGGSLPERVGIKEFCPHPPTSLRTPHFCEKTGTQHSRKVPDHLIGASSSW